MFPILIDSVDFDAWAKLSYEEKLKVLELANYAIYYVFIIILAIFLIRELMRKMKVTFIKRFLLFNLMCILGVFGMYISSSFYFSITSLALILISIPFVIKNFIIGSIKVMLICDRTLNKAK
jgi:hypothetical protein